MNIYISVNICSIYVSTFLDILAKDQFPNISSLKYVFDFRSALHKYAQDNKFQKYFYLRF